MEEVKEVSGEESYGRKFFRFFLITAIFVVIMVLIIFIIYIFVSSKTGISKIGPESKLSFAQAKEQIENCLKLDEDCDELFLREDIAEICKDLKLKNECFYEAAVANSDVSYCNFIDSELRENCEISFSGGEEIVEEEIVEEEIVEEGEGVLIESREDEGNGNESNQNISSEENLGEEDFEDEFLY